MNTDAIVAAVFALLLFGFLALGLGTIAALPVAILAFFGFYNMEKKASERRQAGQR